MGRDIVGDHMDLFASPLRDHDVGKERDELRRGSRVSDRDGSLHPQLPHDWAHSMTVWTYCR